MAVPRAGNLEDHREESVTEPERNRLAALGYVGGAITAATTIGVGVLMGQVLIARWTSPGAEAPPPRSTGRYGLEYGDGPPLRLAVLGDSTAAGYGVHTRAETPGALLATWISEAARRPVKLTCPAMVGSISAWLPGQVETVLEAGADLAIIFIGANDVTTKSSAGKAVTYLAEAVRDLRTAGIEVVVATCPDLGTVRPIQPPLRWLARRWSRQLAEAQTVAVVREGGRTVSLGNLLGPTFYASPGTMFGEDRFHPSAIGYRTAAEVVLPAALQALHLVAVDTEVTTAEHPLPVDDAAALAAQRPGTQVRPVEGPERRASTAAAWVRRHASWIRSRSGRSAAAPRPGLAVPSLGEFATEKGMS
jgi:lysophospholipase L1-like esterase